MEMLNHQETKWWQRRRDDELPVNVGIFVDGHHWGNNTFLDVKAFRFANEVYTFMNI